MKSLCVAGMLTEAEALERILDNMPDGVVVLNADREIQWANRQFRRWACQNDVLNLRFYAALNHPENLGPDFCPFNTALATGEPAESRLRTADGRYFHVHVAPVSEGEPPQQELIVTVREVTEQVQQQNKMAAIHAAGLQLAALKPGDVGATNVEERVELLKSNILHYTQDLLNYDVIEIRLLDQPTGRLDPLLSFGLDEVARTRELFAKPKGHGVTGFVASSGKSYLCEDTTQDPLYLTGFQGAKSSMTVPLLNRDQVIGTFNVESPKTRGFTESDLQFLEIFSRDVAAALNTLDLLVAQKENAACESIAEIYQAIVQPVDDILNDIANLTDAPPGSVEPSGKSPDAPVPPGSDQVAVERAATGDAAGGGAAVGGASAGETGQNRRQRRCDRIFDQARTIKRIIQDVGKRVSASSLPPTPPLDCPHAAVLNGARVLVVDEVEKHRKEARGFLESYGCVVETAMNGADALKMVQASARSGGYDAILGGNTLPDIKAADLFIKLKEFFQPVPMLLTAGFGYDAGHSLVRAREAGLHAKGSCYKPFRQEQIIDRVATIICWARAARVNGNATAGEGPSTQNEAKPSNDSDAASGGGASAS